MCNLLNRTGHFPSRGIGSLHSYVGEWSDVTRFCADHHGVIDRAEFDRLGTMRRQLQRWIRDGRLERAAPRVWKIVGSDDSWRQRLSIGTLSLGTGAAASHSAAAQLHGFDRTPPDVVEFLVPHGQRGNRVDLEVHTSKLIRPHDYVTVDRIRTTSATRTILDLANVRADPDRLRAAIDSSVRLQLSSPTTLAERLYDIRRRGRGGVRLIDELLLDSGGHTMLERHFLRLMREAGLPRPNTQVVFEEGNRTVARVDFLYRERGIVVEVSGRVGHSTPTERARDAQRRNELHDLGLTVYEYTWEDVTRRSGWVIRTMRARLTETPPRSVQRPA